ncbi:MAG: flagellar biosynthetic protein FliO [Lachnospiraceae bacterium]|nr:flagellar biosynthetic protein FliO [Lachnospiraceae bacterium]
MKIFLSGNSYGGWHSFANILSLLLIFVLVLAMAYFSTKFIAKFQAGNINNKSNIKIIESYRIGNNKFIAIVKIGDDYYAIALGKEEVTFIDKLNAEGLRLNNEGSSGAMDGTFEKVDFKDVLSKLKNKKSKDDEDTK